MTEGRSKPLYPFDVERQMPEVIAALRQKVRQAIGTISGEGENNEHIYQNLEKLDSLLKNFLPAITSDPDNAKVIAISISETLRELEKTYPPLIGTLNSVETKRAWEVKALQNVGLPIPSIVKNVPLPEGFPMPLTALGVVLEYYGLARGTDLYAGWSMDIDEFPIQGIPLEADPAFVFCGKNKNRPQAEADVRHMRTYEESKALYPQWMGTIKEAFGKEYKIPLYYGEIYPAPCAFDYATTCDLRIENLDRLLQQKVKPGIVIGPHSKFQYRVKGTLDEYVNYGSEVVLGHELGHIVQTAIMAREKDIVILNEFADPAAHSSIASIIEALEARADVTQGKHIVIFAETPYDQARVERALARSTLNMAFITVKNSVDCERDAVDNFQNNASEKDRGTYQDTRIAGISYQDPRIVGTYFPGNESDKPTFKELAYALNDISTRLDNKLRLNHVAINYSDPWVLIKKAVGAVASLVTPQSEEALTKGMFEKAKQYVKDIQNFAAKVGYDEILQQGSVPTKIKSESERIENKLLQIELLHPADYEHRILLGQFRTVLDKIQEMPATDSDGSKPSRLPHHLSHTQRLP